MLWVLVAPNLLQAGGEVVQKSTRRFNKPSVFPPPGLKWVVDSNRGLSYLLLQQVCCNKPSDATATVQRPHRWDVDFGAIHRDGFSDNCVVVHLGG